MRVSDKLIYSQVTHNLQKNMERLLLIQNSLSSGKKIEAPSDNPIGNSQSLNYTSLLSRLEQYGRNIDRGVGTLGLNDSTLFNVTGILTRLKELAVQMRSDTNTADDRAVAAKEIRQLLREMASLANTEDGVDYLYSGNTVRGRYTGAALSSSVVIASGSNDTLQVKVDGVTSGIITLTPGTYTGAGLATEIQSRINADVTLGSEDVTASYDTIANRLVIASQRYGSNSSVDVIGGTARTDLGLTGGTSTSGSKPFTLATATRPGVWNNGGGSIDTGVVTDENLATQNDYVIKFTAADQFSIYNVSSKAIASDTGTTPSQAVVTGAAVIDTGALSLDNYEIRFTGATTYDIVDTTTGDTVLSSGSYTSGQPIEFDGLRVVIADGAGGGPVSGDEFTVNARGVLVSSGNSYTSGVPITFDGLSLTVTGSVQADDAFAVQTKYVFNGDNNDRRITVGENTTAAVGMSGGNLFSGVRGGTDLLSAVKDFYNSLMGNNADGLDTAISQMDLGMDQTTTYQAEVGARMNYLDTTKQNIEAFKVNITALKSEIEDIDLAKVASELLFQENVLQAAQGAAARVIQPSLLDFLR